MTSTRRTATTTAGRRAGQGVLVGLLALVALLVGPGVAQAAGVTPTASCYQPNSDGTVSVLLGYNNTSGVAQTIPRGASNVITPSAYDGAQPTSFAPGNHPGAFALTIPANDAWTGSWTLDGTTLNSATAVNQCPAGTSLPADGNGLGMTMVILAAGAVAALTLGVSRLRSRRATA